MTTDSPENVELTLRERLEGLMAFRVVIVTLFLGSSIAIDARALSDLSDLTNLTLLSLIVGTYLLTICFAFGLKYLQDLRVLAYFQIFGDMLVTTILVLVTGGLDSLFLFLFYLNIISAAVLLGRNAALLTATATAITFGFLAAVVREVITVPGVEAARITRSFSGLVYEIGLNAIAAYLMAVLAGHLARRLGEVTGRFERQQSSLEELKALNANILSSLASGLLTIDHKGEIIFFNKAAEQITGYRSDQVYGESIEELFPALAERLEELESNTPAGDAAQLSGAPGDHRLEDVYVRPDGQEVFLGFSVSILRNSQGQDAGRIIIFQDLSEVKRLEREKQRSERLAAIGELAAAIAHEIRNPLASISGSVEMLETTVDFDKSNRDLLSIVVREVDRLDKLITNFLEYSRPRPLSLENEDLVQIVENTLRLFKQREATKELEVSLEVDEDIEQAIAAIDREAFKQIVWNLLNNAREAMEEKSEGNRILLELRATQNGWLLSVEDDGPGVTDEEADRIFEPFFTTKESGTGLGLATIHRLVVGHNGKVRARRAERLAGARFELELPKTSETDRKAAAADSTETSPSVDRVEP
ncbi:MAG: two-component system sensor histidine kinase NtrB [Persicimonas sp.]